MLLSALQTMFWGWLALIVMMSLLWLVSCRTKNAGIVDLGWAFGFVLLALVQALAAPAETLRVAIITGMMGLAHLRLGWHLLGRYRREFPKEDSRYHQFRTEWAEKAAFNFFWLFQFQGLLIALLVFPVAISVQNTSSMLHIVEYIAVVIWLIGFVGEAIADAQLKAFIGNPDNKGKTCQVGLWYCSRHPNYFFEWVMWVAYALFALASPWGWMGLLCPLLMFYFLTKVTGVALTEAQAIRSRLDYQMYQKTTSAFFPFFKTR